MHSHVAGRCRGSGTQRAPVAATQSESPEFVLTGSFDSGVDPEVAIWNQLEALLHSLSRRETAWVFRMPVDPVKASAPDYYDIVKCATLNPILL